MHNYYNTPFTGVFKGFVDEGECYGFLEIHGKDDLFVHFSVLKNAGIPRSQQIKGLKVDVLIVEQTERGPRAQKVQLNEGSSSAQMRLHNFTLPMFAQTGLSFVGRVQEVAYACAGHGAELKDKKKEYKNTIKSLPMMIRHNGLVSTLTYLDCHEKEPYQRIYTHLAGRLIAIEPEMVKGNSIDFEALPSATVRKLTFEVMTFLGWLKLYSSGLISD